MKPHQFKLFDDSLSTYGTTTQRRKEAIELVSKKFGSRVIQAKLKAKYGIGVSNKWLADQIAGRKNIKHRREVSWPRKKSDRKVAPKVEFAEIVIAAEQLSSRIKAYGLLGLTLTDGTEIKVGSK